jgi:hypothetical protein
VSQIIVELDKGNDEILRVDVSEYEGREFAQIRMWYNNRGGEVRPTKKGVTLSLKHLETVISALQEAQQILEGKTEKIEDERI